MGTNSSKNQKQELHVTHQKFTNVRQLTFDQIQATISIPNEEEYNKWKSQLKKISSFNKENILAPLNHSFIPQGICGSTSGIVKIVYDNFPYIFQEELQNRAKIQKHLDEQQMWYLLYTLVSTAHDFSSINKKIGDVRPHNIFVNQTGQIKLGNILSWPNASTNYQKTYYQKQKTYISLQEMETCNKGKMDSIINNISAQSFSIGLTMLHAGLLYDFSQIYHVQKFQIDIAVLLKKLNQWQELEFFDQEKNRKITYSSALKGIVKNLCQIHSSKRQSSLEIYKLLEPYKTQILNLEQFQLSKQHSKSLSQTSSQFNTLKEKYRNQNQFSTQGYNNITSNLPINYNKGDYGKGNTQSYPSYFNNQGNFNNVNLNLGYELSNQNQKNLSSQTFGNKNQKSYDYYLKQQPLNINKRNHYQFFKNYADSSNNKQDFLPNATSAVSSSGINIGLPHSHSTYTIQKRKYQPQKIIIKQVSSSNIHNLPTSYKKYETNLYSNSNFNSPSNFSPINNMGVNTNSKNTLKTFTQVSTFQIKTQTSPLTTVNTNRSYGNNLSTNSNKIVEYDLNSNDFLKKIDEQLMKSKSLFPS